MTDSILGKRRRLARAQSFVENRYLNSQKFYSDRK